MDTRPRLKSIVALQGTRLELTFSDGQTYILDMSEAVLTYPGLISLSDGGAFGGVCLGDGGWTAQWPALDIQIGADTLYLDSLSQATAGARLS
jgi:hypothetical protein